MKTKLFFLITSLAVYAANGFPQVSIDWLHSINTHPERGASIARDNSNNTYALGSGGGFIYLTRRDKFGNFKWQVKSTSYLGENAVRVFVDPQGNAVAVGYRYSTLHEGPFAVALIVLKYTPAGDLIYKTVIPGTYTYFNNSENRTNITAEMDGAGNIYIGTEGQVTGYPKQGFNAVKVSSAGSVVWVSTETFNIGSNFFYVSNIRLRGNRLGLEGTTLYFTANASTWVLDTTGHSLWSNVSPGILGQDIAFDKNANTYVLTSFNNNFKYDVGLYKFGKTGGTPVANSYDFGSNELGYRMEMMPNQSLAIMGVSTQQNGGLAYLDWVTFRVDLSGNLIWSKRYDKATGGDEIPRMIKVDASNNIYVTGIGGPFPGGSNLGALQGVTLKYSANGALKWKSIIDTLGFDGVNLALGTDTSVFVISASASAVIHLLQATGSDACSMPANTHTANISSDAATLTWNAVPNAFLYHVEYKTSTGNTWIRISTDQTSYTFSGLFPGTTYDYRVEAVCNGGPTGFSPASHFSTVGTGYCAAKGLNSANEWIDLVLLGAISSSTGNDNGYADYTYLATDLARGSTNAVTTSADIPAGLTNEAWEIWIDYNNDGDFEDAGESAIQFQSSQVGWETHSLVVPMTASLGPTKMRVIMKYDQYATSCEVFNRGEVEDYTVNITDQAGFFAASNTTALDQKGIRLSISPNPATNYIVIDMQGFTGSQTIQVYNSAGRIVQSSTVLNTRQYKMDVSKLNSGLYTLSVSDKEGHVRSVKWIK